MALTVIVTIGRLNDDALFHCMLQRGALSAEVLLRGHYSNAAAVIIFALRGRVSAGALQACSLLRESAPALIEVPLGPCVDSIMHTGLAIPSAAYAPRRSPAPLRQSARRGHALRPTHFLSEHFPWAPHPQVR